MNWQNRITGHGEESPEQLLANPKNWRLHPKEQQDAMKAVLETVGWVQNVIVNRRTGFLVDGHLRVSLAMREGAESVPVVYVDISDAEEALILATLDPISGLAATDTETLNSLLQEVQTDEPAIIDLLNSLLENEKTDKDEKGDTGGGGGMECPQCGFIIGG